MNWTQRYLQALAPYLPKQQRQDICDELEASLLDQLEERTGATENSTHARALIAELGHPALYASGFQNRQALISQPLLEIYKQTLRWLLWVLVGLFCAIELIESVYSSHVQVITMAFSIAGNTLDYFVWGFAIVTAIFYYAEEPIKKLSHLEHWKPEDLPKIQPIWNTISHNESAFGTVCYTIFAASMFGWITPFKTWQLKLNNDQALGLYEILVPTIGIIAILFAAHRLYLCFVPYWQKPTLALNIVLNICALIVLVVLLRLPTEQLPIFVSQKAEIQPILTHLAQSLRWMLVVIMGFTVYELLRDALRWTKVP